MPFARVTDAALLVIASFERLTHLGAVQSIARCVAKAHELGVTHRRLTRD